MDRLISEKAVLEAFREYQGSISDLYKAVKAIPPAEPKCESCEHFTNDHHCVGCVWDEDKGENTKWELKKNPIVIERAVLDKIRAEIEALNEKVSVDYKMCLDKSAVLQIIDKYKERSKE